MDTSNAPRIAGLRTALLNTCLAVAFAGSVAVASGTAGADVEACVYARVVGTVHQVMPMSSAAVLNRPGKKRVRQIATTGRALALQMQDDDSVDVDRRSGRTIMDRD